MADLTRISNCEKTDRVADLVFVHGLDGDARTTWHPKDQADVFWPAWLGEDFPSLGVWSLGYQVAAWAWKGHSMPLVDRATNTLDLLELDEIGRRPLAFICHSLGGLLIKQVLRLASDSNKPAYKALAERTKLVVFLSTPHSGADMASWIGYIGKLLRTTVSVEELEAHHPRLLELNKWYRDHVAEMRIETFVYCEKLPTGGVLVVNQTTADPGISGVDVVPLDEDHVSICKLTERNRVYRRVKRLLADTVMKAESSAPAVHGKEVGTASSAATTGSGKGFGRAKIEVCDRLIGDWHKLADYFEISPSDRARFERGQEPHGIWEWLRARDRFGELAEALDLIGRKDLVPLLPNRPR